MSTPTGPVIPTTGGPQPPYGTPLPHAPQPPQQPYAPQPPQQPYAPQPPYAPQTGAFEIVGFVLAFVCWPVGLVMSAVALGAARREKRSGGLALGGVIASCVLAVLTIALLVGLALWVRTVAQAETSGHARVVHGQGATAPATASDAGGIPLAADGTADPAALDAASADTPVVAVYVDFMCPYCGRFEAVNGDALSDRLAAGDAVVVLHPVAILDSASRGSHYSTRAANALATVADAAPDRVLAFHQALFAHQPAEGTRGLTDDELRDLAVSVGVPSRVADTFADGRFDAWVAAQTEAATSSSALAGTRGFGTPTIVLDGQRWAGDWSRAGELDAAIDAASGAKTGA